MFKDILSVVNWVDILAAGIFVRCIYVGAKKGLVVEIFKFFGMIFAIFVTLHYYLRFSLFLKKHIISTQTINEFLAFVLLWGVSIVIFKIVREGYMLVTRAGQATAVTKFGGILLGVVRGALICGLLFLLLCVPGNPYLIKKIKTSWTGTGFVQLSPRIYRVSYNGFVSKFFPGEVENVKVYTLFPRDKKGK